MEQRERNPEVNGALDFMGSSNVSRKAPLAVHLGLPVPILMYDSERWVW